MLPKKICIEAVNSQNLIKINSYIFNIQLYKNNENQQLVFEITEVEGLQVLAHYDGAWLLLRRRNALPFKGYTLASNMREDARAR